MQKNILQKNKKIKNGFTLIEVMVSVSIFSIVMLIAVGSIIAIVSANKKAQALNSVITNLNFAVEAMVRDLRTGKNYRCIDSIGNVGGDCASSPGSGVQFDSSQNIELGEDANMTYKLMKGADCRFLPSESTKGCIRKDTASFPLVMTSPEVDIQKMDFYVLGSSNTDKVQPQILLVIKGVGSIGGQSSAPFNLQTLISQRVLDL